MKGERKLRLVSGGGGDPPSGGAKPFAMGETPQSRWGPGPQTPAPPQAPEGEEVFTDEEIAAAAALREALEGGHEPLFVELRAAHVPGPLAEADLDAIVTRALGDESATTSAERAAAERLRAELAGEASTTREGAALLVALELAAHPTDLPAARHQALIDAALARVPFLGRRGMAVRRIAPVTMAALASVAAIAAGLALFAGRVPNPSSATAALVRARSADNLFDATRPFPRRGEESARIDRIASARAVDLRQNRFAAWGVK